MSVKCPPLLRAGLPFRQFNLPDSLTKPATRTSPDPVPFRGPSRHGVGSRYVSGESHNGSGLIERVRPQATAYKEVAVFMVTGETIPSARPPVFPGVTHRPAITRYSTFPDWVDRGDMVEMGLQDAARMDSFERSD